MAGPATPHFSNLCDPFLEALPVTSASVSVFDSERRQSTVSVSDPVAARLDELQMELGVGPQWDALTFAVPVLAPSLEGPQRSDWVVFAAAALELGVRAFFAFPMLVDTAAVGVVGLSSPRTGSLDGDQVATAVRLTRRATGPAVVRAIAISAHERPTETVPAPGIRREVHQATGMILVQLDVSASEAFSRLRAHAFATSRTIEEVARLVVARDLDFRDLES